jgi:hypothetical protein
MRDLLWKDESVFSRQLLDVIFQAIRQAGLNGTACVGRVRHY